MRFHRKADLKWRSFSGVGVWLLTHFWCREWGQFIMENFPWNDVCFKIWISTGKWSWMVNPGSWREKFFIKENKWIKQLNISRINFGVPFPRMPLRIHGCPWKTPDQLDFLEKQSLKSLKYWSYLKKCRDTFPAPCPALCGISGLVTSCSMNNGNVDSAMFMGIKAGEMWILQCLWE